MMVLRCLGCHVPIRGLAAADAKCSVCHRGFEWTTVYIWLDDLEKLNSWHRRLTGLLYPGGVQAAQLSAKPC